MRDSAVTTRLLRPKLCGKTDEHHRKNEHPEGAPALTLAIWREHRHELSSMLTETGNDMLVNRFRSALARIRSTSSDRTLVGSAKHWSGSFGRRRFRWRLMSVSGLLVGFVKLPQGGTRSFARPSRPRRPIRKQSAPPSSAG